MPFTEPSITEFLRDLVRQFSPAGREKGIAKAVAARMSALAYDEVRIDPWGSVIGTIRGWRPGRSVLLDAHMDHVVAGDSKDWSHDPLAGAVVGGRLYGRGANDDKASLAAMVLGAALVDRKALAGTVHVSGTVLEEFSEGASAARVVEALRPDYCIIGEGTDLRLGLGQKGRASVLVEARGVPAHSANPSEGVNAAYKILPALTRLRSLPLRTHPQLGSELGELIELISAPYPSDSVLPVHVLARHDCRMLPGETPESLVARWQGLAGPDVEVSVRRQTINCYTGAQLEVQDFYPAWVSDTASPLVAAARQGLAQVGPERPDFYAHFCSNGSGTAGWLGVPTIMYGPGVMQRAHIIDEYAEIPAVVEAMRAYAAIVQALLD